MSTFTGDSRIGTELMYPERKPVGKTKVDRGHPLAKNLLFQTLLNPRHERFTKGTGALLTGDHYLFDGTVDGFIEHSDKLFDDSVGGLVFEVDIYIDNLATKQAIISRWGSTTDKQVYLLEILTTGALQVAYYNGSYSIGATTTGVVSAGNRYHILCRAIGAAWLYWVNGKPYSSTPGAASPLTLNTSSVSQFIGKKDGGASPLTNGKVYMARLYHSKEYTNAQAASLYRKPYQFLVPDIGA